MTPIAGVGLGVTMVPEWIDNNLWPVEDSMSSTVRGIRDAVIITLSTGYRCAFPLFSQYGCGMR